MSNASFYKWRSRFGGMDASMMTRLKELEEENHRLKKCMELKMVCLHYDRHNSVRLVVWDIQRLIRSLKSD